MNLPSIIEALFVALCATTAGFILCAALVGIWWFTVERQHEADALTAAELDIPHDRDFTDMDMGCNVTLPPSAQDARDTRRVGASAFPHDTDYDSTPAKRF